jgi:hypothetical protein
VPEPAGGLAPLPRSRQNTSASIAIVAVPDVYEDPRAGYVQRRVRALARIDLLDVERRAGYLTEASYQVGREIEAIFERMIRVSGGGQWSEGDRVDPATAATVYTVLGIEGALKVNKFLGWMLRHVGKPDTLLLWRVLGGDRLTLRQAALTFGRKGYRGHRYTMDRFRDALAVLADAKAAKGREVRDVRSPGVGSVC